MAFCLDGLGKFFFLQTGSYGVFEHRGSLDNVSQVFQAIWNDWLPASSYDAAHASEFECYSDDYSAHTGEGLLGIGLTVIPRAAPAPQAGA